MQGCICPHPPLLIPEVGGAARNKIAATVTAMEKLAASVGEPETIVVISPHADDFGAAHAVKTRAAPAAATSAASAARTPRSATTTTCSSPNCCSPSPATTASSASCPTTARCSTGACSSP